MKDYRNMEIYVNDNGNESIKAMDENFNKVHFLNVATEVTDIEANNHEEVELRLDKERKGVYSCLDVTIYRNGLNLGRYYIGNIAIDYFSSKAGRRNASVRKARDKQTYICSYTATALKILERNATEDYINKGNIIFGACLPMGEYLKQSLYEEMIDGFTGNFKVEFNRGVLKGKIVEYKIDREDVFVFPESSIGLKGLYYNEDGSFNKVFADEVGDRYLISIDIGSISTDMGGIRNEKPVPQLCNHIGEGIRQPLTRVKGIVEQYIENEYKKEVDISIDELNVVVLDFECKYPFGRSQLDIKEVVNVELKRSVKNILNDIDDKIDINMNNKIYGIYTFGGGSILMKEFINKRLGNRFPLVNLENALWVNAKSSVKVLKNERSQKAGVVTSNK